MHHTHRNRLHRRTTGHRPAIHARQMLALAQRVGRLAKFLVQDGIAAVGDASFAIRAAMNRHKP